MAELTLVTGPTLEPITLAEAKLHLRVDGNDEDTLITSLITSARRYVERISGWTLLSTTWRLVLDDWPDEPYIVLPRPPLQSVSSVVYVDTDGNSSTLPTSDYVVETDRTPGRIHLAYGRSWPSTALRPASPISITYIAGHSNAADVPQEYKQAMLLLIGHWFANREAVAVTGAVPKQMELAVESLLMMDRVYASW